MKLGRRFKRNQSLSIAASGVIAVGIAALLFLTHSPNVCFSQEPVFGDVIREALALGFEPVAYEDTSGTSPADQIDAYNSRETEQCRNLMDRFFAKNPAAQVIVHVGYSPHFSVTL